MPFQEWASAEVVPELVVVQGSAPVFELVVAQGSVPFFELAFALPVQIVALVSAPVSAPVVELVPAAQTSALVVELVRAVQVSVQASAPVVEPELVEVLVEYQ